MGIKFIYFIVIVACWLGCAPQNKPIHEFDYGSPESVGLSSVHLSNIDSMFKRYLKEDKLPGGVAMVIRDGKIVKELSFGHKNLERTTPHRMDDLFRIASMTKAITAVTALTLLEEGKLELDNPLWWYIPNFRYPTILDKIDETDSSFTSYPAKEEITIRHLFNHTSGLGYGFQDPAYNSLIIKHGISEGFEHRDILLMDNINNLARIPLLHEPGEKWTYGLSYDVLGRVIEVVTGKSLDTVMQERIFDPLGMKDTFFYLPESEFDRMPDVFMSSSEGVKPTEYELIDYPKNGARKYLSGGGDLSTTALDFAKFAQMVMNQGSFNGKRILGPRTVDWITNQQIGGGTQAIGMGFGVMEESNDMLNYRSAGSCEWGGYFSTMCLMDPKEKLIVILMKQMDPDWEWDMHTRLQNIVYSSID